MQRFYKQPFEAIHSLLSQAFSSQVHHNVFQGTLLEENLGTFVDGRSAFLT